MVGALHLVDDGDDDEDDEDDECDDHGDEEEDDDYDDYVQEPILCEGRPCQQRDAEACPRVPGVSNCCVVIMLVRAGQA